jgi:hypothetical protein
LSHLAFTLTTETLATRPHNVPSSQKPSSRTHLNPSLLVDVRLDLLERTCVRTLVILPPNNLFPPAPGSFTEPSQHSSSPTKATKELNALPTFVARHRTRWSETITSGSFTYLDQLTRAAILPFPFATLICEHRPGIVSNYGPRTILVQHRLTWTWAADESKGARRYCRSGLRNVP